ncbi:Uncharacterised protein [Mycolicibacterium flavescens]|uniref:hypothetical protein n=1 Tax=Mycobacterium neumannii TaxID=2048551 RepID=UPI000B93F5C8|nr:hypothetical protein [Mycobacterium neumannii]VEG42739.1 Uncharacterised protein [Mycolicibacterium flavescens]
MANPAAVLHRILTSWRDNKNYADANEQRIAARQLELIDELVNQMEATEASGATTIFRQQFSYWVSLVYHHPHGWKGTNSKHVDDHALQILELLADRLDGMVPTLEPDGIDQIRTYAEHARRFVTEDQSITPLVRAHLLRVISHLDWCIVEQARLSDSDFQEAIERLFAAMVRTATTADDKQKWFDWIMTNTVWPFTVNLATAIPAQALAQLLGG